jgi:DNA polymerase-3 subunit beta
VVAMRANFSKQSLSRALSVLNKVVDKRGYFPFLTWVKVVSINGHARLQGTDLGVYLTVQVSSRTEEEGEVCVAVKEFAKLVKGKEKEVLLWTEEDKLILQVGGVKSKLSMGSVEKFPEFPGPIYQSEISTKLLLDAIEKVSFALPLKDNDRDYLRYVLMDGEGKGVNFVASDGYRLAFLRAEAGFDMKLKLPQSGLKVLKELLKREKGEKVKVGKSENFVFIAGSDWEMALRVLDWDYPDYRAVVPEEFKTKLVMDIKKLDRTLESFSNVEMVVFHIGEGVKLRAEWTEYGEVNKVEKEIKASVEGQSLVIAFNPKFLKQFTEINEGTVEMLLVDKENPAMLKLSEDYFYLVMPMRLR